MNSACVTNKRGETQTTKLMNKRRNITTIFTEIKMIRKNIINNHMPTDYIT